MTCNLENARAKGMAASLDINYCLDLNQNSFMETETCNYSGLVDLSLKKIHDAHRVPNKSWSEIAEIALHST
jgi:hypothetical protein